MLSREFGALPSTMEAEIESSAALDSAEKAPQKKDVYTYTSQYPLYSAGWTCRPDRSDRLAVGTIIEEYSNKVEIVELDKETDEYVCTGTLDHPYPTTKVMWIPDKTGSKPDLLATTGDYLRIWAVQDDNSIQPKCLLNSSKNSEYCAPLTSFDWCESDANLIAACSIDTTCTVWQLDTQQVKTQIIAHDKEVYDIAFANDPNVFASVGADGSLRVFDLRNLKHSKILYEDESPLLRLGWSKHDSNYLATMALDAKKVVVIDLRRSGMPVAELEGHLGSISGLDWAPHSTHICTAGEDKQALIWDVPEGPAKASNQPVLTYSAEAPISQLRWSPNSTVEVNWISICFENKLQVLHV